MRRHVLVECDYCSFFHPIRFNGDCLDDRYRYDDVEDYAERNGVSVYSVDVDVVDDEESL